MNELVSVVNGVPTVSSKDIADRFNKVHRNVMRDIEKLDCSKEFRVLNFEHSEYTSLQNKVLPCYLLTRDGFAFLCMGFTGKEAAKWKEAYINAFNKMESTLKSGVSVMQSLNEAMRLMEEDKAIASACGRGLNAWKDKRQDHMQKVERLHNDVQLLLNFKA